MSFCSPESVADRELAARACLRRPLTARSNAAAEAVDWFDSCRFTEEKSVAVSFCSFLGDGDLDCDIVCLFCGICCFSLRALSLLVCFECSSKTPLS